MIPRRDRPGPAWIALLAVLALGSLFAACGEDGPIEEPGPPDPPAGEPADPAEPQEHESAETTRCRGEELGITVEYPADWHTNEGDVAPECSFFDPERIAVPEATEFFGAAIAIRREPVDIERISGEDPATRVVEREDTEVAGRPAIRRETEATGDALLPADTRAHQYLVDLDTETLVLSTYDLGDHDFDRNREVLDDIAQSLELNL